jgi:hypothetical protein
VWWCVLLQNNFAYCLPLFSSALIIGSPPSLVKPVTLAADAKRQCEEQRIKREREEALEREREMAAAEMSGKKYEVGRCTLPPPDP